MIEIFKKWLFRALCVLLGVMLFSAAAQRLQGKPIPMFCGWGAAIVQTGSMEPTVPTGALIMIHQTDSYTEGDIITYLHGKMAVTHRIVGINGNRITAKGDANNAEDRPFDKSYILGRVRIVIPHGILFLLGVIIITPIFFAMTVYGIRKLGRRRQKGYA